MTDKGTTIEQILGQAIRFEEDAHTFYVGAPARANMTLSKTVPNGSDIRMTGL